jgi:hypothetical protein
MHAVGSALRAADSDSRPAGNPHMDPRINNFPIRTLGVVFSLLIPVNGAMADWPSMNGGMMGNGNWYGSGAVWLPVLVIIVLGAVLFAVLRK